MTNQEIAKLFAEVADLLEIQGANPFRIRAYRNAVRRVAELTESLTEIAADPNRKLTDLDGIGKDLAEKIQTMIDTGQLPLLDEMRAEIPPGVLTLSRVPGLGPKKAAVLFHELGIRTLEMLRGACEAEQIRTLKGFGAKTEQAILEGLDFAEQAGQRIYWAEADAIVQQLLGYMQTLPEVERIDVAGSYRRGRDTIGDLDFLVETRAVDAVMDHFAAYPLVADVILRGNRKMSVRLESGLQIDLRVTTADSFGAAMQYFTGSKDHNVVLRGMAKDRGLKINEYGIYRVEQDGAETYLAGRTEAELYAVLDLPCFPPEIREARHEFEWARQGPLPRLVEVGDLQGDLHMHTTATDGKADLEEMVAAAKARGLKYIAITDHSQRVSMARGLNSERLRAQWQEIDRLNETCDDFLVLKGIECDILEAGGMDLPDDVLAEADWVIASVHYGQKQPRAQLTERILGALENPHVDIIAHPTGRLLNRREAYDVDMDAVFASAAKHGKLLELNANPARLDLHDLHCAAAKLHGIPIAISTDAHSIPGLDVMRYGVLQARRGGLTKEDVANTRPWEALQALIGKPGS